MTIATDLKQRIVAVLEHLPEPALAHVAVYVEFVAAQHEQEQEQAEPASDPSAFGNLLQLGQELARDWPAGVQSADVLSAMRDER
jgi:hypothetical protein